MSSQAPRPLAARSKSPAPHSTPPLVAPMGPAVFKWPVSHAFLGTYQLPSLPCAPSSSTTLIDVHPFATYSPSGSAAYSCPQVQKPRLPAQFAGLTGVRQVSSLRTSGSPTSTYTQCKINPSMSLYGTDFTPPTGMTGWSLMDVLKTGYHVGWQELDRLLLPTHLQSALTDTHFSTYGNAHHPSARSCLRSSLPFSTNSLLSPSPTVPPVPSLEYPPMSNPPPLRKCASVAYSPAPGAH